MVTPWSSMFQYAEEQMLENREIKSYLLDFVRAADFNIVDITTQIEKREVTQDFVDFLMNRSGLTEQDKEELKKNRFVSTTRTDFIHTVHNERGEEKYNLPEELQSEGTKRICGLEAAIYMAIQNNGFLFIDEVENSLHPQLLRFILLNFLRKELSRSQLLITTHYDPLLNEIGEIFRKDSIWFTEKTKSGHTEVYSLTDFNGLNRLSSIQKAYNYRKFGAFPEINL